MMHQLNRPATARKFEDPDGFRRTPVSAPLTRRGTDADPTHERNPQPWPGFKSTTTSRSTKE
jgi:hypothetical protein